MSNATTNTAIPKLFADHARILCCPFCGHDIESPADRSSLKCVSCQYTFPVQNGLPLLFCANNWQGKQDVTDTIKSFYEKSPFPDYEDVDSASTLRVKSERGIFARLLDRQMPPHARILEAGCGTGQLSNFLGLTWGRSVFGGDLCLNSLRLAENFRQSNEIDNCAFFQMNLFKPPFKPESFDIVISNGVLHHTSDPFLGFKSLTRLVKDGGYIIIGLYHAYARIPTDVRRALFRLSGNRLKFLDYRLRDKRIGQTRRQSWFMDQYNNPHESKHTMGETLGWFDRCGIEFVSSIPSTVPFEPFKENELLFSNHARGNEWDLRMLEWGMLFNGDREGGFFIMIGRKNSKTYTE